MSRQYLHRPAPTTRNLSVYLSEDVFRQLYKVADALHAKTSTTARHLMLIGLEVELRRLGVVLPDDVISDEEDLATRRVEIMHEEQDYGGRTRVLVDTAREPVLIPRPDVVPTGVE